VRRSHRRHDPVGDPPDLVMGGVGEHDGELLVAGGVAKRVVDRLWLDDQGITLVGPV
jgi:hypothetical protein